jgi:hypothetical protein
VLSHKKKRRKKKKERKKRRLERFTKHNRLPPVTFEITQQSVFSSETVRTPYTLYVKE